MLYKDKDLTEIEGILQILPESFQAKHGQDLDMTHVEQYLKELLAKRENELLESTLGHLSPRSIQLMLDVMSNMNNKAIVMQKVNDAESIPKIKEKNTKKENFTKSKQNPLPKV